MRQRKPSGGQPGNQNARTHGFYSKSVKPEDRKKLRAAADMKGLDQEIALLRAQISNFAEDPECHRLILPGIALLSRLLLARQKLGYDKQDSLVEAVSDVLKDIILPPGMTVGEVTRNIAWEKPVTGVFPPDLPPSGNNESCPI